MRTRDAKRKSLSREQRSHALLTKREKSSYVVSITYRCRPFERTDVPREGVMGADREKGRNEPYRIHHITIWLFVGLDLRANEKSVGRIRPLGM